MSAGLRSALTLAVLALLVLVGALWGWAAFTEPFPETSPSRSARTPPSTPGPRSAATRSW